MNCCCLLFSLDWLSKHYFDHISVSIMTVVIRYKRKAMILWTEHLFCNFLFEPRKRTKTEEIEFYLLVPILFIVKTTVYF